MRIEQKRSEIISLLWIFILLNIIFRDLHEFVKASFMQELLTGTVNGVTITEELMAFGYFVVEIPIAMVLFSKLVGGQIGKWVNIFAAVATGLVMASALPGDLDDHLFAATEFMALAAICWLAIGLPKATRAQHVT